MDSQRTEVREMEEQAARLGRAFDAINGNDPNPLARPPLAVEQDRAAQAAREVREMEERAHALHRAFERLNGNDGDTPPTVPQTLTFLPVDKRGQRA